jgi:hypothetical protein
MYAGAQCRGGGGWIGAVKCGGGIERGLEKLAEEL